MPSVDVDVLLDGSDAFLVALDGVTDPRNLGAVLRCAETAGVTGVVLPRHRSARVTPAVTKAAAGAIEYLPIASVAGIPACSIARRAKACGASASTSAATQSLFDLDFDRPADRARARRRRPRARALTRDRCDVLAHIPMRGRVASLNVAAAAALACHEVARRRSVQRGVAWRVLAGLAQLAEQLICNQQVVGSNPTPGSPPQSEMLVLRARGGQHRALMHIDLTARELAMLDFEREWWRFEGRKEDQIRARFDLSPSSYYRRCRR